MSATVLALVRSRLSALLQRHDTTPTAVARALGRSSTWLRRKLDPEQAQPRALTVADLDLVLGHLGEQPDALLRPVLLPGDLQLLQFCRSPRELLQLQHVFREGERAVVRLEAQCLLQHVDGFSVVVTTEGARLIDMG